MALPKTLYVQEQGPKHGRFLSAERGMDALDYDEGSGVVGVYTLVEVVHVKRELKIEKRRRPGGRR